MLKTVPKYFTLVKKDERVRRPSQRSNVLLKIIHIIYLTYMCVACVTYVTHSSNVLDQILFALL
jgi:glycopeptide antibiotics resistance protein